MGFAKALQMAFDDSQSISLPGPENITRARLPNGIVVLSRADFNSPSVFMYGYLQCGSLFDSDEKLGLADFTTAALMRGSQRHTFQEIYDLLESAGASLGIASGTHTTSFSGKALSEDLGLLLSLISEVLQAPVFPVEHVERLRAQLLTSLAIRSQDTADMAGLAFDQIVYRGHPYRRPDDGYPETIQAIQQTDLATFHRRCFGPRGMVIVVVGSVEPARAVDQVAQALGGWQNPGQAELPVLPSVTPLDGVTRQGVSIPGKVQADLVIGAAGPARAAPDYLAALLGNNILGQFGMMGRIGEVVREQAGLAYYASSSLGGGLGPGPWDVSAVVDPQNIPQAVDLILREIRRFVTQPVTSDELADSQANFIGRMPISLEANSGMAYALATLERYQLGLDYYRRYPELVRAITPEQVLEAAQHYLDPERMAITAAGPDGATFF